MNDTLEGLYRVIEGRKQSPEDGSYTCYLFEKGIDKILKKVGEECTETIIAAKNGSSDDTCEEISDLLYHILVMMVEQGIPLEQLTAVLEERRLKVGNLKNFHQTDKNT